MVKGKYKAIVMTIGALTAVIVIFSQVFVYQGVKLCKNEVKTEKKHDKSSEEQVFISIPSDIVLSSFQAGIHHETVFLFEILFEKEETASWTSEMPVSLGKYFLTLFHIIISPNAP
jgi:hypothetical protein